MRTLWGERPSAARLALEGIRGEKTVAQIAAFGGEWGAEDSREQIKELQAKIGQLTMQNSFLERILGNRLRMQRDFAAHTEIADQQIAAPAICIRMPRTGSTKIQKLRASSGDFNWLPLWQAYNRSSRTGVPGESPEPHIADTDAFVDRMPTARYWAARHPCGSRARMMEWNASNPKDKHGRHRYSLAEYGYTEQRIHEVFAGYIDFLAHLEK